MAVEVKVAPDERLEYISVFLEDRRTLSQYFNLTEYPDTLTGGKNAFLIAGTDYLEPNTEVQIQIRDAKGNVVYTESSDGSPTEYYEGISKVVAAYVYPNDSVLQAKDATAYGPCTITILGELKYYDNNGSKTEVPEIWKGKYNVRWIGTANINPTLANTTRVRFFYRPQATITEILKPIYNVSGTSITASAITASYANIRLTRLETFAGDVKRVKVYRTSQGTVSDFELIQDILIESKELLQTFDATGSVITDTGVFDSQIFQKFWNSGSLNASLNSTQFSGSFAAKLTGSGNFTYTSSLDLSDKTTYELSFDGFYTSSTQSSLKVHISGSQNGDLVVDALTGLIPTKNFTNYITQFTIPKQEPTASLYFSQTQGDWYLKDISLRAAQDTAFSPNEVSFIVSMPTNISNETFNFKFEFFDVNNNFIPVAVTGSQTFVGGNDNLTTIATSVTGLSSSFSGSLTALSQSVSGTISFTSQSVSGTIAQVSSSLNTGINNSYSSSIYTLQTLADGNYSGSFISGSLIYAPVIGGQTGYISGKFTVGAPPNSIVLDATTSTRRIYIGTGTYNNTNTPIYLDSDGKFSLKDKLTFDGTNLSVNGTINVTGGNAATQTYASASAFTQATTAYNNATSQLQLLADGGYSGSFIGSTTIYSPNIGGQNGYISNIFKVGSSAYDQIVLDASTSTRKIYIGSGTWDNDNTGFYVDSAGYFSLKKKLTWNNTTLNITGNINASSISGGTITIGTGFAVDANGNVTATNANLTGTVNATAGQFGSGTNYWKIGTSTIENNLTTNGKVSLNASRPAIEVYDSSGVLKVDINGGSSFTDPGGGGSLNPGGYSGNQSVSTGGNVATGASGASFQSFGQTTSISSVPSFSGAGNVGKTATIKITATGTAGSSNVVGSPVYGNNISLTYGFLIKSGSPTGTTIATVSEAVTTATGAAGDNNLPSYSKEFSTTIVLAAVTYYIVPFVQTVFIQAFTSGEGGGGSITSLTGTVYTPQIASSNVAFDVGKTEIIAGGMQIIRNTSNYFKVDRAGSGDIVLVGGSVSVTGDLTANTSSDIRLKGNIQRIPNPMDKILKISGNTFEWLSGFDEIHSHSGNDVGVIAQEIESVLPEIVVTRDNGYKGVHYEKLVALLIEGMKELQSQIDELKNNK